jgi:hypothetical protein
MKSEKRIVIATSGWVFIGDVVEHPDRIHMYDASVIRVWGTTKGLGQIALEGPTMETILDFCGEVQLYLPAVIAQIKCDV